MDQLNQTKEILPQQFSHQFFRCSEKIDKIAPALVKAIGEIKAVATDALNPAYKSTYATITAQLEEIKPILNKNDLALIQTPVAKGNIVSIEPTFLHTSGQWMEFNPLTLQAFDASPQKIGGTQTYGCRYQVRSLLGLGSEDDDGESNKPDYNQVQIKTTETKVSPSSSVKKPQASNNPGDYVISFGKLRGKSISSIPEDELVSYMDYLVNAAASQNKPLSQNAEQFITEAKSYLSFSQETEITNLDDVPF